MGKFSDRHFETDLENPNVGSQVFLWLEKNGWARKSARKCPLVWKGEKMDIEKDEAFHLLENINRLRP